MSKIGLNELLNQVASVKVYIDNVPEKAPLPAVVFNHIANVRNRVLAGENNAKVNTWRVSVISNSHAQLDQIVKEIEQLDNKSSKYFRNVLVMTINDEPVDPKTKLIRTFIDLKTVDK